MGIGLHHMNEGETNPAYDQILVSVPDHRAQRLSTKDMDVQMRNFLPTMLANIGHQTIARLYQTFCPRHFTDSANEPGNLFRRRFAGEIVPTYIAALGDHQSVNFRLRVDVFKGESPFAS